MFKIKTDISLAIVASWLIALTVSISLPVQIYIGNIQEITISYDSILTTNIIAFVLLFLLFMTPGILPFRVFRAAYASFLGALSLLIWFNASFMFGHYGAFDGRGISIDTYSLRSIVEISIWIIILALSVYLRNNIKNLLLFATALLLAFNMAQVSVNIYKAFALNAKGEGIYSEFSDELLTFSTESNVIHIVLDMFQSTLLDELLLAHPRYSNNFDGFVNYPNTISHYPTTILSIPSMLTGEVYRNNGERAAFVKNNIENNPFTHRLVEAGYRTDFHTLNYFCFPNTTTTCSPLPIPNGKPYLIIDYSIFRAVPDILKKVVFNGEQWIFSNYLSKAQYNSSDQAMALIKLNEFIKTMRTNDIPPTYKFYHSLITHSPWLIDAECKIYTQITDDARKDQALCALNKVFEFLNNLKKMNIYDNSMIIISSDHGYIDSFPEQNHFSLNERGVPAIAQSSALATLLIKPFNRRGKMQPNLSQATLSDIPNTILGALNLPYLKHGEDLNRMEHGTSRIRQFHFYNWSDDVWNHPKLPPITTFLVEGDARDAAAWSREVPIDVDLIPLSKIKFDDWYGINNKNLNTIKNGEYVIGMGWSALGPRGVWSSGSDANLYLPCPTQEQYPVFLVDLMLSGFVSENHPVVKFAIFSGERKLLDDLLEISNESKIVSVAVPEDVCRNDLRKFELSIQIANPISPLEVNISKNSRTFGVRLSKLRYRTMGN